MTLVVAPPLLSRHPRLLLVQGAQGPLARRRWYQQRKGVWRRASEEEEAGRRSGTSSTGTSPVDGRRASSRGVPRKQSLGNDSRGDGWSPSSSTTSQRWRSDNSRVDKVGFSGPGFGVVKHVVSYQCPYGKYAVRARLNADFSCRQCVGGRWQTDDGIACLNMVGLLGGWFCR